MHLHCITYELPMLLYTKLLDINYEVTELMESRQDFNFFMISGKSIKESSKFKILKSTWRACFEALYAAVFEPAATENKVIENVLNHSNYLF